MKQYEQYSLAFISSLQKPTIILPAVGLASLSSCQLGIGLLFFLMSIDFITGVLASWSIWKKDPANDDLKFWKNGFSSERLRFSLVKSITYFFFIICAFGMETIFKLKSFTAETYTDHQITLTLVTIAISCSIEFYSIIFENLPKAGFSIENKVKSIFEKVKSAIDAIKNLKNN
ncbi:phage holin family protein [Chryseobacterium sp.]|uniref:phage holin family protein n=1 Tax=Chryseobacterium sp. TaxID=1871047 RepID=UPI00289E1DB4|nr:phage holin family protein [Chryseobacterium sp.]